MTLDEAIKRCEEISSNAYVYEGIMVVNQIIKHNHRAKYQEELINECKECTEEHRQLAEWLKELKQLKEQEPCEDAISRQDLLKAVSTWDKFGCDADTKLVPYQDHYIPYIHYDDVVKCIKGMSSVTPQPKTGHWIDMGSGQECSECGEIQHGYDNFRFYCAKCGSKNVIESEVEE